MAGIIDGGPYMGIVSWITDCDSQICYSTCGGERILGLDGCPILIWGRD